MQFRKLLGLFVLVAAMPAGAATLIFSENFEGTNPLGTTFDQNTTDNLCMSDRLVTTNAHNGPGHSVHYNPNNGAFCCTNAGEPISCCTGDMAGSSSCDNTGNCNHHYDAPRTFYLSIWMWMSPTMNPCFHSGHHTWRISTGVPNTGGGEREFDTVINSGDSGCDPAGVIKLQSDLLFQGDEEPVWTIANLERGGWTRVEVLFDEGTGSNDGSMMAWYTDCGGRHVWPHAGGPETGHNFVSSSMNFTKFLLTSNYQDSTSDDYWYTDDVALYDGCPTSGQDPTAACLPAADADADGVPDGSDCRPVDATTWTAPTEAKALALAGGASTTFQWDAPDSPGGTALLYDVIRSTSPSSFGSATCLVSNTASTAPVFTDSAVPPAVFYYLVRSKTACGSTLGTNSAGTPRTGADCSTADGGSCSIGASCTDGWCCDGSCCGGSCSN